MITTVPQRIETFEPALAQDIVRALQVESADTEAAMAWAEKVRRFAEIHRVHLRAVAQERFGTARWRAVLADMADVLAAAAGREGRFDPVFLSAALWVLDTGVEASARLATESSRRVLEQLHAGPIQGVARRESYEIPSAQSAAGHRDAKRFGVVVLCPQPRSLYTLSTLALLAKANVPVHAVIVRKLGWNRFVQEFRSEGVRLIWKIWRKFVLQSSENPGDPSRTLAGLADELGVRSTTVPDYARRLGMPCHFAFDFNGDDTRAVLRAHGPSCVVFTGGGLVSTDTIACAGAGIINCHMGVLPFYKGMDVVEWPLLQGVADMVGATTHFMAKGVDTGPILRTIRIDAAAHSTVGSVRNAIERAMPQLMCDTVTGLRDGTVAPHTQPALGRQYFRMHPKLESLLPTMLNQARISKGTLS